MESMPPANEEPRESFGPDGVPAWALTYADAAFRCGQNASQVETALVGKGLSPSQAANAVDRCFESRIVVEQRSQRRSSGLRWVSKGASLLVAALCVTAAFHKAGAEGAARIAVYLLLPMACIWFSSALGSYVGPFSWFRNINRPTPAFFVAIGGWLLLLGVSLMVFVLIPN